MRYTENKEAVILIVEDNDDDFEATVRAIGQTNLSNTILRCEDGDDMHDYINGSHDYADRNIYPVPGMVLLDINMPGLTGIDVIKEIRAHPLWRIVPVVMFTTSDDAGDISACYGAGANGYIRKPVSVKHLYNAMRIWKEYWFDLNVLPTEKVRSL